MHGSDEIGVFLGFALGGVFLLGLSSSSSSSSLTSGLNGCSAGFIGNPLELSGLLPEGLNRLVMEWRKDLSGLFGGDTLISQGFLIVKSGRMGLDFSGAISPLENSALSLSSSRGFGSVHASSSGTMFRSMLSSSPPSL